MSAGTGELLYYECLTHYNPFDYGHGRGHIPIEPGDTLEVNTSDLKAVKGASDSPQVNINIDDIIC